MRNSILLLAVLCLSLVLTPAVVSSSACTSLVSFFTLADPSTDPPTRVSAHTSLLIDQLNNNVRLTITNVTASLPANTTYSLTVKGPSKSYKVGHGGDELVVAMPANGSATVSLRLGYSYHAPDWATGFNTPVLYVPFSNWAPLTGDFPGSGNSSCKQDVESSFGMSSVLDGCICCEVDGQPHADIYSCPVTEVIITPAMKSAGAGAASTSMSVVIVFSVILWALTLLVTERK